jgi:hypothetical protein
MTYCHKIYDYIILREGDLNETSLCIVVRYVVPTIRSELAKELLHFGMKTKENSELLDITQPAVSQYINDKREHDIKFN